MLFILTLFLLTSIQTISIIKPVESSCSRGCDLALGSYYVWEGNNLSFISTVTSTPIQTILDYNPQIPNQDSIQVDARITIPFSCECLQNGEFLGHVFNYNVISGDTYQKVAEQYYSNLTTADWLQKFNSYPADNIPDRGAVLNVTVNCSCGNENIDKRYGLFVTYPLRVGDSLESIAAAANLSADLITSYNHGVNFSAGSGLVYFPGRDKEVLSKRTKKFHH